MPTQFVTFTVEVTARVDCEMERNDYGVTGSPVWYEPNPDTMDVSSVAFDDVNISLDGLSKDVRDLIEEKAAEAAMEKGEWHD